MLVRVECYAGYKGDERPVRFFLDGQGYEVVELLDRWYGQDHAYFKVRAAGGGEAISADGVDRDDFFIKYGGVKFRSTARISWPFADNRRHTWRPMKPPAPVTRIISSLEFSCYKTRSV